VSPSALPLRHKQYRWRLDLQPQTTFTWRSHSLASTKDLSPKIFPEKSCMFPELNPPDPESWDQMFIISSYQVSAPYSFNINIYRISIQVGHRTREGREGRMQYHKIKMASLHQSEYQNNFRRGIVQTHIGICWANYRVLCNFLWHCLSY
jgi:hypothetical protein